MHGLTDYIAERDWEDTFTFWFVWVDDCYHRLYGPVRLRQRGSAPRFLDALTSVRPRWWREPGYPQFESQVNTKKLLSEVLERLTHDLCYVAV
jgi:hypothetical protein